MQKLPATRRHLDLTVSCYLTPPGRTPRNRGKKKKKTAGLTHCIYYQENIEFIALKVCRPCPLVLLVKIEFRQDKGLESQGKMIAMDRWATQQGEGCDCD
jgi:hypothetical protein